PNSAPKFCPPRNVPYALRPRVEAELKRLTELGVISPVVHSDWATPMVPVNKKDGTVRLCGDFKVTLNLALYIKKYPIPRIEDLFASLTGGQRFSKLDLSNAYLQMEVEEISKKLLTISTQKGLFCFNRLPFGVASSPALFQKAMDQVLLGLPHTHCYLDDILVSGPDKQTHLKTLDAVLSRLEEYSLHLKQKKCLFFQESVEYLGHIIDAAGLHKSLEKVRAIMEAPAPGDKAKTLLVSQEVLTHYNPELPLRLACDASPYGVGAVLSHVKPDGDEKPIACASRTLSKAEQNYAQIEREALAIVFGLRKFHQYLYGNTFTLLTDHRLLTTIHTGKGPYMPTLDCRGYHLLMPPVRNKVQWRCSTRHSWTHCQSATPTSSVTPCLTPPCPVSWKWSQLAIFQRRHDLTVQHGCLMWGLRVIVPPKLCPRVLKELHSAHPGVVRMKSLARSYVWWPDIDSQIEHQARSCHSCQRVQKDPGLVPLHPWMWPSSPWEWIHVDFAGPFEGHMYLVVVDAHSKWPEVHIMDSTTSSKTIQVLRGFFSCYGIPHSLVSDNGPQFCSEEFSMFLKANGVKHIRSAPYHPASNGLAERFVQTFKHALKSSRGSTPVQQRLDTFLLTYRNTPHATTKESPAMLFIGRKLHSRLDFLKPNVAGAVPQSQEAQQQRRQLHSKQRQFEGGEPVLDHDYRRGEDKWTQAVMIEKTGPVSYKVNVGTQGVWKRHVDQMLTRLKSDAPETAVSLPVSSPLSLPQTTTPGATLDPNIPQQKEATDTVPHTPHAPLKTPKTPHTLPKAPKTPQSTEMAHTECTETTGTVRRYPVRITRPPLRFRDQ
ncbi:uncharacterized protein K02A2.6-like, partial [Thalassophryne amazonica]|uniref:uncharacterized protein K02A2.6-like n=1 Tax=Thalassophryne amazonica TaxID=390379 RepID=UPI001470B294